MRHVVDVNPVPGGPPIDVGVAERSRTVNGVTVIETWYPPWPAERDLPVELLVSRRERRSASGELVAETFDPPVLESALPGDLVAETVRA